MEAAGQPEESRTATRSGRLLLRMPEELHAELSRASERKGVSMNAFITATLAAAVGWRTDGPARAAGQPRVGRPGPASQPSRRRPVELLLLANLVIVSAVGVLAIVLLVHALG